MTIDWLSVDLNNCFAAGQAYVACSRGRSLETMMVHNFTVEEIKTSDKVKRFYETLYDPSGYDGPLWYETIQEYDNQIQTKIALEEKYKTTKCVKCGALCHLRQVKHNRNGNMGKFFLICPKVYNKGHTFEFV